MKKIIIFLMAATMIIGFAGLTMAADDECITCVSPGTINRACPEEQEKCESLPFDYEDVIKTMVGLDGKTVANYCETEKANRRVLFPACNCENFQLGDTIDISLEILVNGQTGDNGAYWAENVGSRSGAPGSGIQMNTYSTQAAACKDEDSAGNPEYDGKTFAGAYEYLYINSLGNLTTGGQPFTGTDIACYNDDPRLDREARVIIIQPDAQFINGENSDGLAPFATHGYAIQNEDVTNDQSVWAVNIPLIRFDLNLVQMTDVISVRICLKKAIPVLDENLDEVATTIDPGGICEDPDCCCTFTLGTLGCCEDSSDYSLIYPYATPMDSLDWWYGMVITNISSEDGEAEVTVYETDGDTATVIVPVAANNMYVANNQSLMTAFGGTIGDSRAYFEVKTDFSASGFLFIGNDNKSEAMGYLPEGK